MALLDFKDFFQAVTGEKGRLIGCDLGEKTFGLALSDIQCLIATPLKTLPRTQWKADAPSLLHIIDTYAVKGLVVGFPLNMNGSEGPRCQSTRQFITNLLALKEIPICLWDERLSTVAVTRTLLEANVSRDKRGKVVDKMAASYILQGCLDALKKASIQAAPRGGDDGSPPST